jgi:hypothetical protein
LIYHNLYWGWLPGDSHYVIFSHSFPFHSHWTLPCIKPMPQPSISSLYQPIHPTLTKHVCLPRATQKPHDRVPAVRTRAIAVATLKTKSFAPVRPRNIDTAVCRLGKQLASIS